MHKAWSEKDERQYEHIKQGAQKRGKKRAKQIAARTVNKQRRQEGRTKQQRAGNKSRPTSRSTARGRTGRGGDLENKTREELYNQAKKLDIQGRSRMNKRELARAIRKAA